MNELKSIRKIKEGVYILNDSVVINNFNYEDDDGITYTINYDENIISEQEAFNLADRFIADAINNFYKE